MGVEDRVDRFGGGAPEEPVERTVSNGAKGNRVLLFEVLAGLNPILDPARLHPALIRQKRSTIPLVARCLVGLASLAALAVISAAYALGGVKVALLFGLPLGLAPTLGLRWLAWHQGVLLEGQVHSAISMLSMSMKSGYSLTQSLEILGRTWPAPLGLICERAVHEMKLGIPFDKALERSAEHVTLPCVVNLVKALSVIHRQGGDIVQVYKDLRDAQLLNAR